MNVDDYTALSKQDRRLLDQFAYRYTRLQDDIGVKLMPAVLKVLGEDVALMSAIDRFARLEQLGWLASADVLLVTLAITAYPLLRSTIVTTAPLWLAPMTVSHSR